MLNPMRDKNWKARTRGGEGTTPVTTACPEDRWGSNLLRVEPESNSDDEKKKEKKKKKKKVALLFIACISMRVCFLCWVVRWNLWSNSIALLFRSVCTTVVLLELILFTWYFVRGVLRFFNISMRVCFLCWVVRWNLWSNNSALLLGSVRTRSSSTPTYTGKRRGPTRNR